MKKRGPALLQSGMVECAHACLAMVAGHHGQRWTVEQMRGRFPPSSRGTSLSHLASMAREIGLDSRFYRAEPSHLTKLALPCILHWDLTHFVVLESISKGGFVILDPASGRQSVSSDELAKRFTGIALELSPALNFNAKIVENDATALKMIWQGFWSSRSTLLWSTVLAVMLECIALISPVFIQKATDLVLPAGDRSLLGLLTIAFAAAVILQGLVALVRSHVLVRLAEQLTVKWGGAVAGKLLQLPYLFFMQRSMSDINSRFGSIAEIQRVVTHRFIEGLLDGVTSAICLVILVSYSPLLALLTLAMLALYAILRIATNDLLAGATETSIRAQSGQQGSLLEILHGIHSVKASASESIMLGRYSRKAADAAVSARRVQWLTSVIGETGQTILRLHWVLAVAAGTYLAIAGQFTAGMLVAYITYASQFSLRSTRMLDLVAEWRLVKLHGSRLADIVAAKDGQAAAIASASQDGIEVTLRSVRFRYDDAGPWVLDRVDLDVIKGECVAITGRSGSGKSTLAKVLVGLVDVQEGSVGVGTGSAESVDRKDFLARVSCVMQDDQLFSGTLAENVAMFLPGFDRQKVIEACKSAQIHDEIMLMPMRYDTRVIDLGASLSGGQKQRIMLARALFRDPEILILDEASSHLDQNNERLINRAISALQVTRIIIAHRQETLAIADRVLEMKGGTLHPYAGRAQVSPDPVINLTLA